MTMPSDMGGSAAGFSLAEVMVTMAVNAVVVSVFTTGIVQLYRAQNSSDALASATGQIHVAFIRLDRDIRYASGISRPGLGNGGAQYVEYAITNTGVQACTQVRLTTAGLLQSRRRTGAGAVSRWSTLASQLIEPMSFARHDAGTGERAYQQMTVLLTASAGGASVIRKAASTFTFTALNTSPDTASDTVCSSLGRL